MNRIRSNLERTIGLLTLAAGFAFAREAPGQNWTATAAPVLRWNALTGSADGRKLAAIAQDKSVYTSADAGLTWRTNEVRIGSSICTTLASSADGNRLVVGGLSDYVYTTTNGGLTWRSNNLPIKTWTSVLSSPDGARLWAASGGDFIYTSADQGQTWRTSTVPMIESLPYLVWGGLACSANGTKVYAAGRGPYNYALGTRGGLIYSSDDSGSSWKLTGAPSTNWCSIACSADGTTLVAAQYDDYSPYYSGAIFTSTNSGATWAQVTNAPDPWYIQNYISVACSANGRRMAAAVSGFSRLGFVLVSSDSGLTWSTNGSPSGLWTSIVSVADGGRLTAAMSQGGIYACATSPEPPLVRIRPAGSDVVLSWTVPSLNLSLQESPDLHDWRDAAANAAMTNLEFFATLPMQSAPRFYRLWGQ